MARKGRRPIELIDGGQVADGVLFKAIEIQAQKASHDVSVREC